MKRSSMALVLAIAAVGLAFSGCLGFNGITFSKTKLKKGQTSTVKVTSVPTGSSPKRYRPFLLVGTPDEGTSTGTDDPLQIKGAKFDVTKQFGHRAKHMSKNVPLLNRIKSDGNCGTFDLNDGLNDKYTVLAPSGRINDHGATGKKAVFQYSLKQVKKASLTASVTNVVGYWNDADQDNSVDNGEFACEGGSAGFLGMQMGG